MTLGISPVPDRKFRTFCVEFGNEARFGGIVAHGAAWKNGLRACSLRVRLLELAKCLRDICELEKKMKKKTSLTTKIAAKFTVRSRV
jgi:hypothetical protein